MSRLWSISDGQWEVLENRLPPQSPVWGRSRRDHRQVLEGIVYRYRTGVAWRDLHECYGPWQTVRKRHRAWTQGGTLDAVHRAVMARADARSGLDWDAGADSSVVRAHQHATNTFRHTRGLAELQELAR